MTSGSVVDINLWYFFVIEFDMIACRWMIYSHKKYYICSHSDIILQFYSDKGIHITFLGTVYLVCSLDLSDIYVYNQDVSSDFLGNNMIAIVTVSYS